MSEYKIRILTPEQAMDLFATKGELAAVVAGENGGGGVAVWGSIIGVLSAQTDLQAALNQKQFKLTEGDGISIDESDPDNPIISVVDNGGGAWGEITGTLSDQLDLQEALDLKQNIMTLVEGSGIAIDDTDPDSPIISVSLDSTTTVSKTATLVTPSLAAGGQHQGSVTMSPLYVMSHIAVDKPARVRIYNTTAQQTADLARPIGTDPDPSTDHGVILDFALAGAGSRYLSPLVTGSDITPTGLPITVDNIDSTTGVVTVTITYWDLSVANVVEASGGGTVGPIPLDENYNATITTGTGTDHIGNEDWGYGTVAGTGASIRNTSASAYGDAARASGYNSSAFGNSATASGEDSTAIGDYAEAGGAESGAIGADSRALGERSFAASGGTVSAPYSAGVMNYSPVIHTERTVLGMRDFEVRRANGSSRDPLGSYGSNPQTGIILTDSAGAKWRITVGTTGTLTAVADNSPNAAVGFTLQSSAGLYQNWTAIQCSSNGQYAIATRYSGNIYTTSNYGSTWTARTSAGSQSWGDCLISANGLTMFASYPTGAVKSTDGGASWTPVTIPTPAGGGTWTSLSGTDTLSAIVLSIGAKVYKSTNLGTSWTLIYDGFTDNIWTITAMSGDGTTILLANRGTGNEGFCEAARSLDGGTTFTVLDRMPYPHGSVNSISTSYTGEYTLWPELFGTLRYTDDIGDPYYEMSNLRAGRWSSSAISSTGDFAIVGDSYRGGIYVSDNGIYYLSYVQASAVSDWNHVCIASDGSRAYAIDGNGINHYVFT